MALHVKTPKDQDLRVKEQPREGSRDRGYWGTKDGGPPPLLAALSPCCGQFARPVGKERREMGYLVLPSLKNLAL